MDLDILFLGTAGSTPTARRGLPATLVSRGGDRLLFDCGEGTQRQLLSSVGLVELEDVFVTHFHADHFLGLPGMLKSFALRGRERPLRVHGPPGLRRLFDAFRPVIGRVTFPLELLEVDAGTPLRRDGYSVTPFPVEHGVRAYGYALVEDERPGRFDEQRARELGVEPGPDFGRLHAGEPVTGRNGEVVPEQVVGEPRPGRKVVIAGDTAPAEMTRVAAHQASLLVHEATFGADAVERAAETAHSTARAVAELAAAAEVALLALTHLSPRYAGPELRDEARSVFDRTIVPRDYDRVEIPFPERGEPVLIRARDARPAADSGREGVRTSGGP
ncbi:MAG TPA: ribonuclease Z [Thermoleophilaceae bacterium]|nr:ribonuclease Z [Thermoleophilaceae bacterium]